MTRSEQPEQQFPLKLTRPQRQAFAVLAPRLANRLKLEETPAFERVTTSVRL